MSNTTSLQVQTFQFRTKSIIEYYQYALPSSRKSEINYFLRDKENRESVKTYTGDITVGSKKRLTKAVSLLIQCSQERQILNPVTNRMMSFKMNFITLTMPISKNSGDAKYCHKNLLEPFLRTMRRKYGMRNYIWKCELTKQGNVHYHLTSNCFIHLTKLREEWNKVLLKGGMLEEFQKVYGHANPNSTDVHKVYKVKNFEAYLIKYVTKENENGRKLNAKVWDCSRSLKNAKYFTIEGSNRLDKELETLQREQVATRVVGDRFSIFKFNNFDIRRLLTPEQYMEYFNHLKQIRNDETHSNRSKANSKSWSSNSTRAEAS